MGPLLWSALPQRLRLAHAVRTSWGMKLWTTTLGAYTTAAFAFSMLAACEAGDDASADAAICTDGALAEPGALALDWG